MNEIIKSPSAGGTAGGAIEQTSNSVCGSSGAYYAHYSENTASSQGRFDDRIWTDTAQQVTGREVIQRYAPERWNSAQKAAFCPFHDDGKKPNLHFYRDPDDRKNKFICFSAKCGKKGDVIDLASELLHLDNLGALRRVRQDFLAIDDVTLPGEPLPASTAPATPPPPPKKPRKPRPPKDYSDYLEQCAARLSESPAALDYLQRRGIPADIAAALGVGFDPEAKPAPSLPAEPRLIFPCGSGYTTRRIDDNPINKALEVKGAKKGVFNPAALGEPVVFVVEGEIDALSVITAGGQAVALCGSAPAPLLSALEAAPARPMIILSLDNDEPGQTATKELEAALTAAGYKHLTRNISGSEKDPNAALIRDVDDFTAAVGEAIGDALEALESPVEAVSPGDNIGLCASTPGEPPVTCEATPPKETTEPNEPPPAYLSISRREYLMIPLDIEISPQFLALSEGAKNCFRNIIATCHRERIEVMKDRTARFTFAEGEAAKYGMDGKTSRRYLKQLEQAGFISIVESGKAKREANMYMFSELWRFREPRRKLNLRPWRKPRDK